jgi:hypothetical protein
MTKWIPTLAMVAVIWSAAVAAEGVASSAERRHPHIVILFVDDMGYGDPGCYNPSRRFRRRTSTVWLAPACVSPMPMLRDRCVIRRATGC